MNEEEKELDRFVDNVILTYEKKEIINGQKDDSERDRQLYGETTKGDTLIDNKEVDG